MFIFWHCFSTLKRAYKQRIRKGQKNCHKRKKKQAKTNKQYTGTAEYLLKIFAISTGEHVALISENAVFSFNSHRHGSVFRCFPDSLFFWRVSGNNHLTSATNWRLKITRLMPGKKSINIEGVLRLRLGIQCTQKPFYYCHVVMIMHLLKSTH